MKCTVLDKIQYIWRFHLPRQVFKQQSYSRSAGLRHRFMQSFCLHCTMPRGIKVFLFVAMETFYPLHFLLSLVFSALVHLSKTEFWWYSPGDTDNRVLKELMNTDVSSKSPRDLGSSNQTCIQKTKVKGKIDVIARQAIVGRQFVNLIQLTWQWLQASVSGVIEIMSKLQLPPNNVPCFRYNMQILKVEPIDYL